LQQRGLLTDGGAVKLAGGLRGRGGVLSLTTQDVRGSAHGLTRELLLEPDATLWPELADNYYRRYDRGKSRRPSRLQRLYLQWSFDQGPLGLLEACRSHPHLWSELREVLGPLRWEEEELDRMLLWLACQVREERDESCWLLAYQERSAWRPRLVELLPLLPYPILEQRLAWLAARAEDTQCPWQEALLLACRLTEPQPEAVPMPPSLIALTLRLVKAAPEGVDPAWLAVLRPYRWPAGQLERLQASLRPGDPVRRIVYGARPGRSWWEQLWETLRAQALPE
jgi:hypothetical protein